VDGVEIVEISQRALLTERSSSKSSKSYHTPDVDPRTYGVPMKNRLEIASRMKEYPDFYQAVWKACAGIPRGEVRTYGWIAKKIGKPGAARAVGRALGANPFAPVIPCHRVVRADGSLGGYSGRGGIRAKKRLLEREKLR
jgi:O-6-methylguanine DNA methyltransferase